MRTADEFRAAATERGIKAWDHHDCSLCGYMVKWVFEGDTVYFDSGCWCCVGGPMQLRSWEDVAAHYNLQSHPGVVARFDEFWGFA